MVEHDGQIVCTSLENCQVGSSTIKRILVPFDSSQYSERAFILALDLAHHYNATLTTLTVLYDDPSEYLRINHQSILGKDKLKKMNAKFDTLKSVAKKFGITVKNDVFEGKEVLEPILSYITTHHIDLVVMGSRGRSGPHQYVIGSIAMGVCKNSKIPVMLVK